jgi:hypothetical protein
MTTRTTWRACPRCDRVYEDHSALSRRDNATEICPDCGVEEALIDAGFVRPGLTVRGDAALDREDRFRARRKAGTAQREAR